jgi:glutamate synthase (NADPH/NADH) small chain
MPTTAANATTSKYAWSLIARTAPPKRAAAERVADYHEIYSDYDEATVREQASRCIQCPNALCAQACPLSNRIPEWLALAAQGQFLEAAALSRSTSNMPEICSRVCPQERLCEGACILNCKSDPVAIGSVERFINEYAFAHDAVDAAPTTPNGLRAAIIGSGPAGLACADELAQLGYRVTVFESLLLPGGLLVNGIPAFKLEKSIVARRVDLLAKRGVEFKLGVAIGRDVSLAELRRTHDAVFLGHGAQKSKTAGVPGENLRGVEQALPFLIQKNVDSVLVGLAPIDVVGKRVAVLGGGDTAMDCLRTALRAGAKSAVCLYRRDFANMPGSRKEYYNALEEGAEFQFLTNPTEILPDGRGGISGVRCVRMELGAPDASGRCKPRAVPGSEFDAPVDLVLVAYGFDPVAFPEDSEFSAIKVNEWGGLVVDRNQMTSLPGVFAGGDSVRGPSLVVHAVRDARRAAAGIHRQLATRLAPATA